MTVVVGFNYYTEMLVLADTRVSWPNQSRPPQDILRKLYTITDGQKTAVFGFSGRIKAAKTVMQYLIEEKFQHIKRRLILVTLKDNLRSWIEEVAQSSLSPEERSSLSFLLCGLEPGRPPFVGESSTKVSTRHLFNNEIHLYTYRIVSATGIVQMSNQRNVAVIGSGKKNQNTIVKIIQNSARFGFSQPNIYWARALLVTQQIAELFDQNITSADVGGVFQTIRITPNGIEEYYICPPYYEPVNVKISRDTDKTYIYNPQQNQTYTLYPVWNSPLL